MNIELLFNNIIKYLSIRTLNNDWGISKWISFCIIINEINLFIRRRICIYKINWILINCMVDNY